MRTKLIAFATAVLCTIAISLGLAGKIYTVNAMEYGRSYQYYVYATGESDTYTLYGEDIVSTVSSRSGTVDDRVPDHENVAVVQLMDVGGSGFIVDDHTIATAAHCVYNHGFISSMRIKIYNENCTAVLKTITPKEVHVPNQYIFDEDGYDSGEYDYALLYVEEDLSQYGVIPLAVPTDNFMSSNSTVTISGFPDNTASNPNAHCQIRYYADGQIQDLRNVSDLVRWFPYMILCNAYGSGGDSGGPIYVTTTCLGKEYKTAIGVFTSIYEPLGRFYGTRVTSDLLKFYYNNDYLGVYDW
ncbi:trypsin-like serine protease [Ruminococcus sp.]|uniref:trypsin-like serine peptidase n=1 Tax=Ruminococcus sp. TaxID=41978 RepID=UPI0025ECF01D|nr:trypsin-like serine protease [Ruminococcus sp.]